MRQTSLSYRIALSDHTYPIGRHNRANEVLLHINASELSVTGKQEFMDATELQVEMLTLAEILGTTNTCSNTYICQKLFTFTSAPFIYMFYCFLWFTIDAFFVIIFTSAFMQRIHI